MKNLNERRDKLAEKYETEVLELNPGGFTVADYVNSDVLSSAFSLGFDAAVDELMPEIEKLVKALEFYQDPGHWGIDMPGRRTAIEPVDQEEIQFISETKDGKNSGFLDVRGGKRAREALTNFKEFMGDEE